MMSRRLLIERLKQLALRSSPKLQGELKRYYFSRRINRGAFISDELEFAHLHHWLQRGDWALDVGANVGHFTLRMADIVGPQGRVIAIEPVLPTFSLLAANIVHSKLNNVTLLNVAASERGFLAGMVVPGESQGSANYYRSHLTKSVAAPFRALAVPLDFLPLDGKLALIKVDVEGHELEALNGMTQILAKNRPLLIVEGRAGSVTKLVGALGYLAFASPGSPNQIFSRTDDSRTVRLSSLGYEPVRRKFCSKTAKKTAEL